jgi:hypothetical protein
MTAPRGVLQAATAAIAAMLTGAMILIRLVLVPFWRGVPPREFRAWFGAHSGRLRRVMLPLGAGAVGTAVATTAVETRRGGATASAAMAAAASAGVVAVTLSVNEPANAKFEQPDLGDDETTELLGTWARWHEVRVVLGLVATAAALRTVDRR